MLQHGVVAKVRVIPRVVELAQMLGCLPNHPCKDVDVDVSGPAIGCIQPAQYRFPVELLSLSAHLRNHWRGASAPNGQRSRTTGGHPTRHIGMFDCQGRGARPQESPARVGTRRVLAAAATPTKAAVSDVTSGRRSPARGLRGATPPPCCPASAEQLVEHRHATGFERRGMGAPQRA